VTGSPAQIAVDGTKIDWIDMAYGTVQSCAVDTCQSATGSLYPGPGGGGGALIAGGLAIQGGRVFFSETAIGNFRSELYSCASIGGGPASAIFVGSGAIGPTGPSVVGAVAADTDNVYWTYAQTVYESPLSGCANLGACPSFLAMGGVVGSAPGQLAVRDGSIYFAQTGSGIGTCKVASGVCMPADPTNQLPVTAVAAGPSGVYWTSGTANQVLALPLGAADAGIVGGGRLASVTSPGALAVDSENAYFATTQDGGAIYSCAVGGCNETPSLVASHLGSISALAVDAQRIYAIVGAGNAPPPLFGLSPSTGTAIVWIAK